MKVVYKAFDGTEFNNEVEYVKMGSERDAIGTHKFTGVTVRNVKVGRPSGPRD